MRPFRSPFRRLMRVIRRQSQPWAAAQPELRTAQSLLADGKPEQAAEIFESLAGRADSMMLPQAAPLYLQAANAWFSTSQPNRAEPTGRRGLELLAENGRWRRLEQAGTQIVMQLMRSGQAESAADLQTWLTQVAPAMPVGDAPRQIPVTLPSHCPACNAPVNPREVEWVDAHTALCDFCGTPIRPSVAV